jgi:hypothetical protein
MESSDSGLSWGARDTAAGRVPLTIIGRGRTAMQARATEVEASHCAAQGDGPLARRIIWLGTMGEIHCKLP